MLWTEYSFSWIKIASQPYNKNNFIICHIVTVHKFKGAGFSFSNFDSSKLITARTFSLIRIMGEIYLAL